MIEADQTLAAAACPPMTRGGHRARNRSVFPSGAPPAREMAIGQGFPSPNQPDKGRTATYRAGLERDLWRDNLLCYHYW